MKIRRLLPRLLIAGALSLAGRSAALEPLAAGEQVTVHEVRAGDTIPRICWRYKVRTDAILNANPGVGEPLTPGQRLIIPLGPAPDVPADPPAPAYASTPPPSARPVAIAVRTALPPSPVDAAVPRPTPILLAKAVTAPAPVPTPPAAATSSAPTPGRGDFLDAARSLASRRLRYDARWTPPGEREPWVMDCSNTSRYLYRTVAGVDIGRTASDQYYFLKVQNRAWKVPTGAGDLPRLDYLRRHLQPGDLLFWENTYRPVRDPDITHVMVYLGEDEAGKWQMAGSQESEGVSIYRFDPQAPKGGYSSWFGLVHHEGRFVAYGRPLDAR